MTGARLAREFAATYGREPEVAWAAPGRVNLIGEHTDYNGGFVLPFALPHRVVVAAARRADGVLAVRSAQAPGEPVRVPLAGLTPGRVPGWAAYAVGPAWALRTAGYAVGGADLLVDGDVPQGAGLSSSAALECAVISALDELYGLGLARPDLARLAQRAENDFVGMPCGIMDQSAALLCAEGHALFLDCRSLESRPVPLDLAARGLALLVIDTRVKHELTDSGYADRRAACEEAARTLGVEHLRQITPEELDAALGRLPDPLRRRVRHVVTENARVLDVVARLDAGDLDAVGPLLSASHASLRDDYEVSCPELDAAVDAALAAGALGARMTGGGFGGCAIALVDAGRRDAVAAAVREEFAARGFPEPRFLAVTPAAGAARLDVTRPD